MRRTGAYMIAWYFGSDVADVTAQVYQPSKFASPRIYNIYVAGDPEIDYVCCPAKGVAPPSKLGLPWIKIGELEDRIIYGASSANFQEV